MKPGGLLGQIRRLAYRAVPLALVGVSSWFSYLALVEDDWRRLQREINRSHELRKEYEMKQARVTTLAALRRKEAELLQLVRNGSFELPKSSDDSVKVIGEIADASDVTVRAVDDLGNETLDFYRQSQFEVVVHGEFVAIAEFAKGLAAGKQLFLPLAMDLRNSGRGLTMTIRLAAIVFPNNED